MAVRAEPVAPTWRDGSVMGWLTTVDHKRIGVLYIVSSFVFFIGAGVMALLIRLQRRMGRRGRGFAVVCPDGPVRRIFELTDMVETLHVRPSREAALSAVGDGLPG